MTYIVTGTWKTRVPRPSRLGTPMNHRTGLTNQWSFTVRDRESAERSAKDLVESQGALVATFEPEGGWS